MKSAGFLLGFSAIFFFSLYSNVFADEVVTGNSTIETHITNISSNGKSTSHVETTVNGKTDIEDSNEPGELDVKNINGTVTVTKTPVPSIAATEKSTASATITPRIVHKNFVSSFFENFRNLLKRIFKDL